MNTQMLDNIKPTICQLTKPYAALLIIMTLIITLITCTSCSKEKEGPTPEVPPMMNLGIMIVDEQGNSLLEEDTTPNMIGIPFQMECRRWYTWSIYELNWDEYLTPSEDTNQKAPMKSRDLPPPDLTKLYYGVIDTHIKGIVEQQVTPYHVLLFGEFPEDRPLEISAELIIPDMEISFHINFTHTVNHDYGCRSIITVNDINQEVVIGKGSESVKNRIIKITIPSSPEGSE